MDGGVQDFPHQGLYDGAGMLACLTFIVSTIHQGVDDEPWVLASSTFIVSPMHQSLHDGAWVLTSLTSIVSAMHQGLHDELWHPWLLLSQTTSRGLGEEHRCRTCWQPSTSLPQSMNRTFSVSTRGLGLGLSIDFDLDYLKPRVEGMLMFGTYLNL